MFYEAIQPGLDFWQSSFFCGSAAVLRRGALEEIGGFSTLSVTEDAATSLDLHARGWDSAYLLKPMISGLQPETFTSFVRQRMRWAQGMVQLFVLKNPLFLKGLKLWQRLGYFNCMLFWFFPFARVIFLLAPLFYLYFGLHIYDAGLAQIAAYTIPYLLALILTTNYLFGRVRWFLLSEIYESMQSLFTLQAVFETLRNPQSPRFVVTPKGERLQTDFISPLARPFYILMFLTAGGILSGWWRWQAFPDQRELILITMLWAIFNLLILTAALGALYERRQRRHSPRLPADRMSATLNVGGYRIAAQIQDFSIGGAALKLSQALPDDSRRGTLEFIHPVRNKTMQLRVEIISRHPASRQPLAGVHFSPLSLQDYRDVVLLVHGDSRRWERILRQRDRDVGILRAFLTLVANGLLQAWEHLASLLPERRRYPLQRWLLPGLALVLLVLAFGLRAEETEGPQPVHLPLAEMMARPERVVLRNVSDDYVLHFPISPRRQVRSARLHLDFFHSAALVASRSQLRIKINGVTVSQWRLSPTNPHRIVDIPIPAELLVSGYNELRFITVQHYTESQCEDPTSPELWTEIDTVHSHLDLLQHPRPIEAGLSALSRLIDPTLPDYRIHFLIPTADFDDDQLAWGSLIAQGIALRRRHAPFTLDLTQAIAPPAVAPAAQILLPGPTDGDTVLIGTRRQLRPLLGDAPLRAIQGAYLGIFPAPQQPEHFVLVISGITPDEVHRAAEAFSLLNFPLPDSAATLIREPNLDPVNPHQGLTAVVPEATYSFSQLGFATRAVRGLKPRPLEIEFFMPADWYAPETAEVILKLHLSYSAGMRRDSLLEMRINGIFERAVPLPAETGSQYQDYYVAVPLRTLKPGRNRISFLPRLVPAVTGECLFFHTDHLALTLYDDSTIEFPAVDHYAELPDLALLSRTGFPYLQGSGAMLGVRVLDASRDSILSAWHLMGRLARLNGLPLTKARLSFAAIDDARHLFAVGPLDHLNPGLFKTAPVNPTAHWKTWFYSLGQATARTRDWKERLWRKLFTEPGQIPLEPRHARIPQTGGIGSWALGMSFPTEKQRLITLFTAKERLYPAMRTLTGPSLWAQMRGDLILWRPDDKTLHWQKISPTFYIGDAKLNSRLIFHFARHPWQWLTAVLVMVLLLSWIIHRLLRRFKHRLHPDARDFTP
ncbi:cellulose biosynthesis cyclic di-GMP-binding regulatory protein BcsB [Methylomarinovum caldicuralii]|uniref:cellulose biosynthesis cyclic di-GMP-binding regulatory protein BcsB n=1 Tax=Methylomarinovum caldicuralii TaxID=438856 RepID=UPI0030F46BC0